MTVYPHVTEALGAVPRLEHGPVAGGHDDVRLERHRDAMGSDEEGLVMRVGDITTVWRQALGVLDGELCALGAEIREAQPAVARPAEVDDVPPRRDLTDG